MFDVYDLDERKWSCWDDRDGYLCGWMDERAYLKWYWVHLGCKGRKLPGTHTILRSDADEREANRVRKR